MHATNSVSFERSVRSRDQTDGEVARILRSSTGTVKSQASRGIAALRSILEDPA